MKVTVVYIFVGYYSVTYLMKILCTRRVYRNMSASSEAYYRLRCEFATSHAQLCISHYILGIGDRHLSNFMLDLQTGAIVGIDFGHAFGSATQVS